MVYLVGRGNRQKGCATEREALCSAKPKPQSRSLAEEDCTMTITFKVRYKGAELDAMIDEIDADLLETKWVIKHGKDTSTYYLQTRRTVARNVRKTFSLHRTILERVTGRTLLTHELVDHENRNGLDNTRKNLRLATPSKNTVNRGSGKHNKLGIRGVHKKRERYYAEIRVEGKGIFLGSFATPEEADTVYREALKHYFGEFAPKEYRNE